MPEDKKIKVINEGFIKDLRVALEEILFFDDWQEAYKFVRKFEPPLTAKSEQIPEPFRKELGEWVIKAKWSALPALKEEEVVDLFQNHFAAHYDLPGEYYDLWDKLRAKLVTIPFYDQRDELRQKIKNVLIDSSERITSEGPLAADNKEKPPTVKNWLLDYISKTNNEVIDAVKLNEYMVRHSVIDKLSEKEKDRLKELFNFFEIVKISSLDPQGYEETISIDDEKFGPGIVKAGRFIPLGKDKINEMGEFIKKLEEVGAWGKKLDEAVARRGISKSLPEISVDEIRKDREERKTETPAEILAAKFQEFAGTDLAQKALGKSEELAKQLGKDIKKIRNSFYTAVNNQDKTAALATMFVLAENKQISQAFGEDERFINFWSSYLEKAGLEAEAFKNDPAGEKHLARFFKYILEKRLKLDEAKAVMVGMALSNLARGAGEVEYQNMVYGDLETGEFEWNVQSNSK